MCIDRTMASPAEPGCTASHSIRSQAPLSTRKRRPEGNSLPQAGVFRLILIHFTRPFNIAHYGPSTASVSA